MPLKFILPLFILFLNACGFSPVYSTKDVSNELAQITVRPIAEREGQILRNNLLDRGFGTSVQEGNLDLKVENLLINEVDLGISSDNTSTRRQLTIAGNLKIYEGDVAYLERTIVARTSYNVLLSQYGTNVTRDNALNLAINDMARQIESQSLLALKAKP